MNPKNNIANIERDINRKFIASIKKAIEQAEQTREKEISLLNSEAQRPIYRVNDIAGESVGKAYLNAPESLFKACQWTKAEACSYGKLFQGIKALKRLILRTENLIEGKVN